MATSFCASSPCGQASKMFKPLKVAPQASKASRVARPVTCSAQKDDSAKAIAGTVAAAALAAVVSFGAVDAAYADISGLTPCAESKAFQRRKAKQISGLEKRMAKYEADSAPAIALQATMDKTNKRFDFYGKSGLLCGADGLPHLIADPGFALKYGHAGDIVIPAALFVYIAGYIGYTGRDYLAKTRGEKSPTQKEIIIDVPLAFQCLLSGFAWPLETIQELRKGTLTEKPENITVSPR
eukprot:evm.model.scf_76.18 EVM.evm.TU.scf_76.18   scf_76:142442-144746(+)